MRVILIKKHLHLPWVGVRAEVDFWQTGDGNLGMGCRPLFSENRLLIGRLKRFLECEPQIRASVSVLAFALEYELKCSHSRQ